MTDKVLEVLRFGAVDNDIGSIATQLGVSERTLQRRLTDEAQRFSDLQDSVLRERATTLLGNLEYPLVEVAYTLGFSEPSAFYRAVKRWYGKTPRVVRHELTQTA